MKTVGLRELKNRLGKYVRQVRSGRTVVVTDRGRIVAELRPAGRVAPGTRIDEAVAELVNRGLLSLGTHNDACVYPRLPRLLRSATSAELLDAERGTQ